MTIWMGVSSGKGLFEILESARFCRVLLFEVSMLIILLVLVIDVYT